jgi:hypothetical protein
VDILDGAHYGPDEVRGVAFVVVPFGTDAVEELATCAKIEDEVEIVRGFEVIVEGYDVGMAAGNVLEDGDFIANLEYSLDLSARI